MALLQALCHLKVSWAGGFRGSSRLPRALVHPLSGVSTFVRVTRSRALRLMGSFAANLSNCVPSQKGESCIPPTTSGLGGQAGYLGSSSFRSTKALKVYQQGFENLGTREVAE